MPRLDEDGQAETTAGIADLLQRGVFDTNARAGVDQYQLPLQGRQPRRLLGEHRRQHLAHAKLLGALALQIERRDAAFDHLNADRSAVDVLRRERSLG